MPIVTEYPTSGCQDTCVLEEEDRSCESCGVTDDVLRGSGVPIKNVWTTVATGVA